MSLLFNILSRLVIAFLPRSKCPLISWLRSPCAVILEPQNKSLSLFPLFPHLFAMKWWDQVPWSFLFEWWVLSQLFHCPLSFSSRGSSVPSLLSALRVVSSVNLTLLIYLPAILIPAYASSSPAFFMMYSAYKLNKQGDNIQTWGTPFLIQNESAIRCPVLTVASSYRFLRRRVRWSGIPISLRIFHSLLWSTQSRSWHSQ